MSANTARARAFLPLLTYCRIVGLVPYVKNNPNLKSVKTDPYYPWALLLLYLTTSYFVIYNRIYRDDIFFKTTTDILEMVSNTILVFYTLFDYNRRNASYTSLHYKIYKIDDEFNELREIKTFDTLRKQIVRGLAIRNSYVFTTIIIQMIVADGEPDWMDLGYCFIYYYPQILNTTVCYKASFYTNEIRERFMKLNELLLDVVKPSDDKSSKKQTQSKLSSLNKICSMHRQLSLIIKDFNKTFGIILMLGFGVTFVTLVVGPYYCALSLNVSHRKWARFINSAMIFFSYLIDVVYVCHICDATTKEAVKSSRILYDLEQPDPELKDEIEMFSIQMANIPVEFNASGYFPINNALIFSIISGAVTHLIILLQLKVK